MTPVAPFAGLPDGHVPPRDRPTPQLQAAQQFRKQQPIQGPADYLKKTVLEDLEAALRSADRMRPEDPIAHVLQYLAAPDLLQLSLTEKEERAVAKIQAMHRGRLVRSGRAELLAGARGADAGPDAIVAAILSKQEDSYTFLRERLLSALMEPLQQCAAQQPDDPASFISAWLTDTLHTAPTPSARRAAGDGEAEG